MGFPLYYFIIENWHYLWIVLVRICFKNLVGQRNKGGKTKTKLEHSTERSRNYNRIDSNTRKLPYDLALLANIEGYVFELNYITNKK